MKSFSLKRVGKKINKIFLVGFVPCRKEAAGNYIIRMINPNVIFYWIEIQLFVFVNSLTSHRTMLFTLPPIKFSMTGWYCIDIVVSIFFQVWNSLTIKCSKLHNYMI